jgi:hypothetical protein
LKESERKIVLGRPFTKKDLTIYPIIFISLYILIYGAFIASGSGLLDRNGKPIGADFVGYWAASNLILSGNPEAVYDEKVLYAAERKITGTDYLLPINYPPNYLLMIAPLSILPYLISLLIWIGSTFLLYLILSYRIAPHFLTIWLAAAFPGAFQNIIHGNNGFLSAIFLGTGLILIERIPFVGGIVLGLLTYKPHLAVIIPFALIVGRYWKALFGMVSSAIVMAAITYFLFGREIWVLFIGRISSAFSILGKGYLPLSQIPSVFGTFLLAGITSSVAILIHIIVALGTLIITLLIWYRPAPFYLRAAILSVGILLISPHICTHDLAILGLPIAWIGWEIYKGEKFWGQKFILVLCWIAPLICTPIAVTIKVQIVPFVLVSFLLLVLLKFKRQSERAATSWPS